MRNTPWSRTPCCRHRPANTRVLINLIKWARKGNKERDRSQNELKRQQKSGLRGLFLHPLCGDVRRRCLSASSIREEERMEGERKRGMERMLIGTDTEKRGKNETKMLLLCLIFQCDTLIGHQVVLYSQIFSSSRKFSYKMSYKYNIN